MSYSESYRAFNRTLTTKSTLNRCGQTADDIINGKIDTGSKAGNVGLGLLAIAATCAAAYEHERAVEQFNRTLETKTNAPTIQAPASAEDKAQQNAFEDLEYEASYAHAEVKKGEAYKTSARITDAIREVTLGLEQYSINRKYFYTGRAKDDICETKIEGLVIDRVGRVWAAHSINNYRVDLYELNGMDGNVFIVGSWRTHHYRDTSDMAVIVRFK